MKPEIGNFGFSTCNIVVGFYKKRNGLLFSILAIYRRELDYNRNRLLFSIPAIEVFIKTSEENAHLYTFILQAPGPPDAATESLAASYSV